MLFPEHCPNCNSVWIKDALLINVIQYHCFCGMVLSYKNDFGGFYSKVLEDASVFLWCDDVQTWYNPSYVNIAFYVPYSITAAKLKKLLAFI
jgi:hypothetical protein